MTVDVGANTERYLEFRGPTARYTSFDYCYNYFQSFHERDRVGDLVSDDHVEKSCLQLGFYLASWGMLRGSSDLLHHSVKYYAPVIEAIVRAPESFWDLDVSNYTDGTIDMLLELGKSIRGSFLRKPSDTLVTKILLGVFGCVPAYDSYFKRGMGVSSLNRGSLRRIREFYDENAVIIEESRVRTLDFGTGLETTRSYPQAKVIDMTFFIEGSR